MDNPYVSCSKYHSKDGFSVAMLVYWSLNCEQLKFQLPVQGQIWEVALPCKIIGEELPRPGTMKERLAVFFDFASGCQFHGG